MIREYWLLLHHSMTDQGLEGFMKMAHGSILELTMDGDVFLWPRIAHGQIPDFTELCEVCERYLSPDAVPCTKEFRAGCMEGRAPDRPCAFVPAPEADAHQDFESFLIDGTFLVSDGPYRTVTAFFQAHNISQEAFYVLFLGTHSSIRECRERLAEQEF